MWVKLLLNTVHSVLFSGKCLHSSSSLYCKLCSYTLLEPSAYTRTPSTGDSIKFIELNSIILGQVAEIGNVQLGNEKVSGRNDGCLHISEGWWDLSYVALEGKKIQQLVKGIVNWFLSSVGKLFLTITFDGKGTGVSFESSFFMITEGTYGRTLGLSKRIN